MSAKAETQLKAGNLLVYKQQPAVVAAAGDKIEILTRDGRRLKVRPKDVLLLHEGPLASPAALPPVEGDVQTAWELLQGDAPDLQTLAELAFEEWSPAGAWAAWELLQDGLYFEGEPDAIVVRDAAQVQAVLNARAAREAARNELAALAQRLSEAKPLPQDAAALQLEMDLARGGSGKSAVLKEMELPSTPDAAYEMLLRSGIWGPADHPYPERHGVDRSQPRAELPQLEAEERLDLRALDAWAIDDADSSDPDDAVSLDGDRIWVHVADAAALIRPDSPADLEARARGANLYLPEGTTNMLPEAATDLLGLGLAAESPALSIGFKLTGAELEDIQVRPSLLAVQRLTYAGAEEMIEAGDARLSALLDVATQLCERRRARDAAFIELPEVKVRVRDGEIHLIDLPRYRSRMLVTEFMLAAGEAAARFALAHEIPFPFTSQAAPDELRKPRTPSEMFAYRKTFKRSRMQSTAEPHAGLGLEVYARATSPLRRYLDLVVHQQLRAFVRGEALMDEQEMLARVGAAEAVGGSVRSAERDANRHWTLEFLRRNPAWRGEAVLLERRGAAGYVMIPALGMELSMTVPPGAQPDDVFTVTCDRVDPARLDARFLSE